MEKVKAGDKVPVEAHARMWGSIWNVSADIYTQE